MFSNFDIDLNENSLLSGSWMSQNWVSWLMCWRAGLFLLRNLNKLKKRADKNLIKSNKHNRKALYLECNKSIISLGWGQTGWVAYL